MNFKKIIPLASALVLTIRGRVLHLGKTNEITFNLRVINNRKNDNEFSLLLYVNYNKIPFFINGETFDVYNFNVKSGEEINIPVNLDSSYFTNKINPLLVAVIPVNFIENEFNNLGIDEFSGTCVRYDFVRDDIDYSDIKQEDKKVSFTNVEREDSTLIINKDYLDMNNLKICNETIKVSNNKNNKFALRAGGKGAETYIALLNISNSQLNINTNKYWFFNTAPENKLVFKKFELDVNELENGNYSMYGFIIPRPFDIIDENDTLKYAVQISEKIKVEVVK